MKQSFYNFLFEHNKSKYIYNTLSTALASLDDETFGFLEKNEISLINSNTLNAMIENGFIVEDSEDEYEKYMLFYNSIRYGESAGVFSLTFMPTYNCNLACPYCMQGLSKDRYRISKNGVDSILKFAGKQIIETGSHGIPIREMHIALYGGEPTLEKERLKQLCVGIREIANKENIPIYFTMTSNFTMIDDDFIDFIEEYDITTQVSIDGTREQHDQRRITKDGKGTYDVIISNLEKLKSRHLEDHVVIRLNIDKNNIDDAEKIFSSVEKYSTDVYFGFLDHFEGNNDCFGDCVDRASYSYEVTNHLDKIVKDHGFPANARFGKQAPCAINCINNFFIDWKLDVYKCEMLVNIPEMKVGYISDDGEFVMTSGYYHQMGISPNKYPECRTCKLLPMCAGGCAGKSFFNNRNKNGRIEKSFCNFKKEDLYAYLRSYIELNGV